MASKNKTSFKSRLRGATFCFLWFFSILFGFFFLICPAFILVIINPKWYRRWSDLVFAMWEMYPVAMMEILFGVKVIVSGDTINPFEGAIIIMNHRTRLDWNFLWAAVFHCCDPLAHNLKFILKAPIMHVPGPGWVMQACSFIFIHRNWEKDQKLIGKMLDYLGDTDPTCHLLIFPEGTDLTKRNLERSHKYADDHGLDRYYRVLHPKTTGFAFLANKMLENHQLEAVYDMTVGYPKTTPETELDMLRGQFPEELHFFVKRHDVCHLPRDENELKKWLSSIWQEKERKLQRFYNCGSFIAHDCTPDCFEQNCTNEILTKCALFNNPNLINREFLLNNKNRILKTLSQENYQQNINTSNHIYNSDEHSYNTKVMENPEEDLKKNITNENRISKLSPDLKNETVENILNSGDKNVSIPSNQNCDENLLNDLNFDHRVTNFRAIRSQQNRPSNVLYLALLFWTSLVLFSIYVLFFNIYCQMWALFHSLLFIVLSFTSPGFHLLIASLFRFRYRMHEYEKKCE